MAAMFLEQKYEDNIVHLEGILDYIMQLPKQRLLYSHQVG